MDNVFEILIYAVIIISFLSSFFKKKKEPPKTEHGSIEGDTQTITTYKGAPVKAEKKEVDDYDILREIEKMFKMETPEQPVPLPKKVEPVRIPKPVQKSEKRKVFSENTLTQSEHAYSKYNSYDASGIKPPLKVKSYDVEEKYYSLSKPLINPFADLKRKLREPQTMRDYIIVSEIIGKPKALRR